MISCSQTSPSNSPSHRRGFKLCPILWSPRIKISSFKCNLRQCLALISLFPRLPNRSFLSYDLAPDLDPAQGIARVFREPSNLDPRTSRHQNQTRFVTPLSCYLKHDINKPTSRTIVVLDDLDPYLSAGLDSGRVIAQVFRETFLLNSSCHDFEKSDEGQKMSSQLWQRMLGYI